MKEIELNHGKVALVDDDDYEKISQFKWHSFLNGRKWYARHDHILMHRFILNVNDPSIDIDHKDGNGLNNQKNNIRTATRSQNSANSSRRRSISGFRGVTFFPNRVKGYMAQISLHDRNVYLGFFLTAEEAARAYDKAALRLHGEFARINFPDSLETQVRQPVKLTLTPMELETVEVDKIPLGGV